MTRKQALHKALEGLTDGAVIAKIEEILADMPFTGWSERTIWDTVDQFVIDYGRIPTVSDFKKKGMPSHTVIRLRFGATLKNFLDNYYPREKRCDSEIYGAKTKEQWRDTFIAEYIKNRPATAQKYNSIRAKGTPSWATVAKMFGITKWLNWLDFCDVTRADNEDRHEREKKREVEITVSSEINLIKKRQ